jgi:Glutathione-dependent formaldehyde-activating enzyme
MTGRKALDVSFLPSYISPSRGGKHGKAEQESPSDQGDGWLPLRRRPIRGTRTAASSGRLPLLAVPPHQRPFRGVHRGAPGRSGPDRVGGLSWYQSSATARRGFCEICGSSLFWEPASGERVSIAAGTLDPPTRLSTAAHVFVEDSGDYYAIGDGLPRRADGDHGIAIPAD